MKNNSIKVKNSGSFWGFLKWFVILILVILCFNFLSTILLSFGKFLKNQSLDIQAQTDSVYDEGLTEGWIDPTPEEEKTVILEGMENEDAIEIADIVGQLSIFDYKDVVVFVKDIDTKPYNVVFRKTSKGLVLDGMMLKYYPSFVDPFVSFYGNGSTSYAQYKRHDFQQTLWVSYLNGLNSCFSFNNNVSKTVLYNQGIFDLLPFRSLINIFPDYSEACYKVNTACQKIIYREFTSFNDKQHLMFANPDEFSDFYTDVYNAVKTLNKDCLVDATNTKAFGLYDGNSENRIYYKAKSLFEVDYTMLGWNAYKVNIDNYDKNHNFNCKNLCTAIPEIIIKLNYNADKSQTSYEDGLKYISKNYSNNLSFANMTIAQGEINHTFNIKKSTTEIKKYLNLGEHTCSILSPYSIVDFNLEEFTCTIDTKTTSIRLDYTFKEIESEGPEEPPVEEPGEDIIFNLQYLYDFSDIQAMFRANSEYLNNSTYGFVQICGYDDNNNLCFSLDREITTSMSSLYLQNILSANLTYKVTLSSPLLTFTKDNQTSDQFLEFTFDFKESLKVIVPVSYVWNGQVGGFEII